MTAAETTSASQGSKNAETPSLAVKRATRRKARRAGDKKRTLKLQSDKEFAKGFFAGRSKRSVDKKQTFRKKKSGKKK
jgi:hypothetical protein